MKIVTGGLALGLILIAGCSGRPNGAAGDPYAGLQDAIRAWKNDVTATDRSCKSKDPAQKCEMFDISCKAQRVITPDEQASGVSAKLVAEMTWSGFDDKGASQPASAAALFEKTKGIWSRSPYKSVNPESCADM